MQRSGWNGPTRCLIYKMNLENISHMFLNFPYILQVWEELEAQIGLKNARERENVEEPLTSGNMVWKYHD